MTSPNQVRTEINNIGPTEALSLRVSTAVITKTTFIHPITKETMLVLERKASVEITPEGVKINIQAQPLGGGSHLKDAKALSNLIGKFNYDSKESAKEQDFRIQIKPEDLERVKDFCVQHFTDPSSGVIESDPSRELAEELHDALGITIDESDYKIRNIGVVCQASAISNRAGISNQQTVRTFNIFEINLTEPRLVSNIIDNSNSIDNHQLIERAYESAVAQGKKGKATALFAVPLSKVLNAFKSDNFLNGWPAPEVDGIKISDNTAAVLCEDLPQIKIEERNRTFERDSFCNESIQAATIPSTMSIEIGKKLLTTSLDNISLIPMKAVNTKAQLREIFPNGDLFVCDFYLEGAEHDNPISGGYRDEHLSITIIDHHAPDISMFGPVSSGNLAIDYRSKYGVPSDSAKIIINHYDCDSIVSSLILGGHLPPDRIFSEAVIAADHTGEENPISDLLQALDYKRNLQFSVKNLAYLLMGKELDHEAKKLLAKRQKARALTLDALNNGAVIQNGPLTIVNITKNMRNEFMPAMFPNALVIFTFEEGPNSDTWIGRYRLGMAAPPGFTLFSLNLKKELDPNLGGRWNGASNKRGGGSKMPLNEYINKLEHLFNQKFSNFQ